MKIRESHMPDQEEWENFFNPLRILKELGISKEMEDIADFGCGYGTFACKAANMISGIVYAIDIDSEMVACTAKRARMTGDTNVKAIQRDILEQGTGLDDESLDAVLIFNLLHGKNPLKLLEEAHRTLRFGGKVCIIHWKADPKSPRGPPVEMRVSAERVAELLESTNFFEIETVELKPWHYGIVAEKS